MIWVPPVLIRARENFTRAWEAECKEAEAWYKERMLEMLTSMVDDYRSRGMNELADDLEQMKEQYKI